MKRACIAVMDAASARLFSYADDELREERDLVSAGRRAKDEDLFSETSPGSRAGDSGGRTGGGVHGATDDHRNAHRDEMDSKFAAQVTEEVERLAKERGLGRVVVVTPPRMLGVVRPYLETMRKHGFVVDEVDRELGRMTVPQVHDFLADAAVIEPRRRAVQPRR